MTWIHRSQYRMTEISKMRKKIGRVVIEDAYVSKDERTLSEDEKKLEEIVSGYK